MAGPLTSRRAMELIVVFLYLPMVVVSMNPVPLFAPNVEVDCVAAKLKITVKDTNNIVTVVLVNCIQEVIDPTTNSVVFFDDKDCPTTFPDTRGGASFVIIIQQSTTPNPLVDRAFTAYCDGNVAVVEPNPKPTDGVLFGEVCPEAFLSLKREGTDTDFVSGSVGERVYMTVEVVDYQRDDYDIVCERLTANSVLLVDNGCSVIPMQFPTFSKVSQGQLATTPFDMFRAGSNIVSAPTDVVFECTLKICLGPCTVGTCAGGEDARGRKRRKVMKEGKVLYRYPVYSHVTLYPKERPTIRKASILQYLELPHSKAALSRPLTSVIVALGFLLAILTTVDLILE